MTFTNLEKYLYSKKYLKQRRPPPLPPAIKVEGIFALEESLGYSLRGRRLKGKGKGILGARETRRLLGYGCYLQLNYAYPADRVRKLSVYRSP